MSTIINIVTKYLAATQITEISSKWQILEIHCMNFPNVERLPVNFSETFLIYQKCHNHTHWEHNHQLRCPPAPALQYQVSSINTHVWIEYYLAHYRKFVGM